MLILTGCAGSGKTTVLKALEEKGYRRIITYTTRPPRKGEIDGTDYNFIGEDLFSKLDKRGYFAETSEYQASFGRCRYGSARHSYDSGDGVIALDINGVKKLKSSKKPAHSTFVVLLYVSEELLKKRLLQRGDSEEEIRQRLQHDRNTLSAAEECCDITITIDEETTVEDILKKIEDHSADWQ